MDAILVFRPLLPIGKKMNINEITIGQAKEISKTLGCNAENRQIQSPPLEVGKAYLFRTVTHIELGRVTSVHGPFVTLDDASWIADTGRYHDCLRDGTPSEVEPYPLETTINAAALINYAPWPHKLPREQK